MDSQINIAGSGNFLEGRFPYRLLQKDPRFCEWLTNSSENFTEPFFNESIGRLRSMPANQHLFKSLASLDMLPDWAKRIGMNRSPAAIIFHVSRCGSTLLSQLLALQQQHMVLSEVPFFDELLRLPFKNVEVNKNVSAALFNAALQLYIQSSRDSPQHVFLKTDSWHLHFYGQLRSLYPAVPFILLYREPWQVLQSQQRRRGMQSVPGLIEPAVFGFTAAQAAVTNLDEYMALVLSSYFEKMIAIAAQDPNMLLINYNEGAACAMQKIATATGIGFDAEYEHAARLRSGYHGKYPGQVFNEDENSETAPDFLNPAIALYGQLEVMRNKQRLI